MSFNSARDGFRPREMSFTACERSEAECHRLAAALGTRLLEGRQRLEALAEQRAGTDKLREQVNETLCRWFIPGKTE
ncbi:MAG TPA: hypothetical protein VIS78_01070 [Blastocatellia bacterium]